MASLFDRLKTSIYPIVAAWVTDAGDQQIATPSTPLPVSLSGYQSSTSTGNTTTTPLASSATYTGTGESNGLPQVGVSCYSDTAGTLYFQFKNPGSLLWHTIPTSGFPVNASQHLFQTAVKLARDFRAKFVNSASPQTVFELFTYFGSDFDPSEPDVDSVEGISERATTTARLLSAANTTNATNVKALPGRVFGVGGFNAGTITWLKLYDKATAPDQNDTPRHSEYLPANTRFQLDFAGGLSFVNGIGYRLTTGSADNDTNAVAAGAVLGLNLDYA